MKTFARLHSASLLLLALGACGNPGLSDTTGGTSGAAASSTSSTSVGSTTSGSSSGGATATASSGASSTTSGSSGHTATTSSGVAASTTSGSASASASGATSSSGAGTTSGSLTTIPDPDPSILPVINNPSNNAVLNPISVVTVTFTGYPYTAQVQGLGAYLASSNYIQNTVGEYGVGPLTNVNVDTGQTAPGTTTDTTIQGWITSNTGTGPGMLPAPATGFLPLYVLYYPSGTTVTNTAGGTSCVSFSGYHLENYGQIFTSLGAYYYAVVNDCGTGLADVEAIAVHEIAEAASDPLDIDFTHDAWADRDTSSPYVQSNLITEIGDLCEGQYVTVDAGSQTFTLQQLWSEAAALDGGAPCVPVDPDRPYFTVLPDSLKQTVPAGSTATFHLTGWSSAPFAAWGLSTYAWTPVVNAFTPTSSPQLSAPTISNGQVVTLSLDVPAGTASGASTGLFIYSQLADGTYNSVPVMIYAQ